MLYSNCCSIHVELFKYRYAYYSGRDKAAVLLCSSKETKNAVLRLTSMGGLQQNFSAEVVIDATLETHFPPCWTLPPGIRSLLVPAPVTDARFSA